MPDLVLDNLVFDLQPHGGITSIWEAILRGVSRANDIDVAYLQADRHDARLAGLAGHGSQTLNDTGSTFLRRFRKPRLPAGAKLFHSSYFRVAAAPEIRNIVTVHDCVAEKFDRGPRRVLHLAQKKSALRAAHTVICVSESTRRDLLELYPWLAPERVITVHNGIDLDYFTPNHTERGKALLYVGARSIHKNFGLALDLVASPIASEMGLSLDVLGGGTPTTAERERIAHLGIADRVRFLGPLNLEGVRAAYRRAFALVYPSFYEGFGIPPLEAMACGCPVLCSNRSSLPEVVGDAAILFDPTNLGTAKDALSKLCDNSTKNWLIDAGFARSAQFSSEAMVERTIEVYRRTLA
jgi:glycosyltransferase involved in cell wall biosynthesis